MRLSPQPQEAFIKSYEPDNKCPESICTKPNIHDERPPPPSTLLLFLLLHVVALYHEPKFTVQPPELQTFHALRLRYKKLSFFEPPELLGAPDATQRGSKHRGQLRGSRHRQDSSCNCHRFPEPWVNPKSGSTCGFCNLHQRSTRESRIGGSTFWILPGEDMPLSKRRATPAGPASR